jgi:hypothetical protein
MKHGFAFLSTRWILVRLVLSFKRAVGQSVLIPLYFSVHSVQMREAEDEAFFIDSAAVQRLSTAPSICGLVVNPPRLTLTDLRSVPASHVSVTQVSGHGPETLNCIGRR